MQIHQVSLTYQPEQDRLLLRVSSTAGQELRLWLTRRLMLGLWPMLSRLQTEQLLKMESAGSALHAADDDLRRMVADFRKEEFLQHADFDTPWQDQAKLPLGAEPMLVTDVDAAPLPDGRARLSMNERASVGGRDKPRGFQLELDARLMHGLVHLLDQALTQAQWREPFVPPTAVHDTDGEAGASPPRYLN